MSNRFISDDLLEQAKRRPMTDTVKFVVLNADTYRTLLHGNQQIVDLLMSESGTVTFKLLLEGKAGERISKLVRLTKSEDGELHAELLPDAKKT